jgi:hypothetical protein
MELQDMSQQRLHPLVLDCCFLMMWATRLILWVAVVVLAEHADGFIIVDVAATFNYACCV